MSAVKAGAIEAAGRQALVGEAAARFPKHFGLRDFPGMVFRIDRKCSGVQTSFSYGELTVMLAVERSTTGADGFTEWVPFERSSEAGLRRAMRLLPAFPTVLGLHGREREAADFADRPSLPLMWARLRLEAQHPMPWEAIELLKALGTLVRAEQDMAKALAAVKRTGPALKQEVVDNG